MSNSRLTIYSLVLTFVLVAADPPKYIIPGGAPQIQHPGVELDVLTAEIGVADEVPAEELPPEVPNAPEAAKPARPRSLRTYSPELVDILDILDRALSS